MDFVIFNPKKKKYLTYLPYDEDWSKNINEAFVFHEKRLAERNLARFKRHDEEMRQIEDGDSFYSLYEGAVIVQVKVSIEVV